MIPARKRLLESLLWPRWFDRNELDVDLRANVLLVELGTHHCGLDVVFDLCLAWKPTEGGRKRSFDMHHVEIRGDAHPNCALQVVLRRILLTVIVERKLEAERIFILTGWENRIDACGLNLGRWIQLLDFIQQLDRQSLLAVTTTNSLTLCHSNSVLLLSGRLGS